MQYHNLEAHSQNKSISFSGRKVVNAIGGGIRYKYHWIAWKREGPKEGPPLIEKVIQIMDDASRSAKIALVASGKEMKYYLATENMKPGDLIRTSQFIPRSAGNILLFLSFYLLVYLDQKQNIFCC